MAQLGADWQHGYYAAEGYTHGYYREMAPASLAWAGLLQGVVMPDKGFRYVDLGCGQGFNLILLAANHPDSQFVGVDFMPNHVRHAQKLAADAGLTNVRFVEGDFVRLVQSPESLADATGQALDGLVDYVVAHGISSWVSPEVRSALWALTGRLLRPGGMHYTSYNTLPGWLPMVPFQRLVLLYQQAGAQGPAAIEKAMEVFGKLEEAKSPLFAAFPTIKGRLEMAAKQDKAYLTQEYNNDFWQPQFIADVMGLANAVKLDWLGSATLPEAFDGLLPLAIGQLVQAEKDPAMREVLRDLAMQQAFRRDLYIKGKVPAWPGERNRRVLQTRIVGMPGAVIPQGTEGKVDVNTPMGKVRIDRAIIEKMCLAAQQPGGATIADFKAMTGDARLADTLQRVCLMIHAGWLALDHETPVRAGGVNLAIARAICDGAPYRFISAPRIGQAITIDVLQAMMLAASADGLAAVPDTLPPQVELLRRLDRVRGPLNLTLHVQGKEVTEGPAFDAELARRVTAFSDNQWPQWKALGVI